MIKRILFTAAAALMLALSADASSGKKNNTGVTMTFTRDSVTVNAVGDTVAQSLVFSITGDAGAGSARIVDVKGTEYLLHDGNAFKVENFKKLSADRVAHKVKNDMRDEIMAYHDNNAWNDNIVALMSIIFIVPCLTILILSVLLIMFLNNKNRSRNNLISKAIDNNYPLPDSFYGMQAPASCEYPQPDGAPGLDSGARMVNAAQRDPRKFSSAVTLIAVGVGLTSFLLIVGAGAVSCFGLIPLLIGAGQLVGYYYVPGFTTENLNSVRRHRHYGYDPYASREACHPQFGAADTSRNCPPPPPASSSTDHNN